MRKYFCRDGYSTHPYTWEVDKEGEEGNLYFFDIDYTYITDDGDIEIQIDKVRLTAAEVDGNEVNITSELSKKWERVFQEYVDNNWYDFCFILTEEARADLQGREQDYWDSRYEQMRE